MDLGLHGRRALVGGGGSGIGGGIATVLAGEGARVALIGRTRERIEAEAARLGGVGVVADLSAPDGPRGAVEDAVAALGGLDLVVVNTGGPPGGTFETLGEAEWEAAIAGTLQSTLRLIRASLPHLRAGVDPAILIVLSSSVREPIPALTTSNVLRPGLAGLDQDADGGDRPDPDQRARPGPHRHGPDRIPGREAGRGRRRHPRRRSPGGPRRRSRSAATATSRRSGGWGRSCSRPPRRSSPARSSRWTGA